MSLELRRFADCGRAVMAAREWRHVLVGVLVLLRMMPPALSTGAGLMVRGVHSVEGSTHLPYRAINPYFEGPFQRQPVEKCTLRNGCKAMPRTRRLPEDPIAKRVGKGRLLGVVRTRGYPVSVVRVRYDGKEKAS